jgi:hypothetical protein
MTTRSVIGIAMLVSFVLFIIFSLILYYKTYEIKRIEINPTYSNKVKWNLDNVSLNKSKLVITGWAFIPTEKIKTFRLYVILHNLKNDEYYQLPTEMVKRNDVDKKYGNKNKYILSGFESKTSIKQIARNNDKYEVILFYEHNGNHKFINTRTDLTYIQR